MPIIYSGNSGGPVVETRKEKLYTAIATGNASLLENLLSDPVYRLILSEMTFSPSEVAIDTIISSQTALNTVTNSSTAMNAIVNSSTAMNAIVNSSTAMTAVANSSTAMTAVANSSTAMTAIINNQTALNTVVNSSTAMNAIVNSSTAMNMIINNQTALDAISSASSTRDIFANSTALPRRSVPTMISNTAPEGQAIGSSFNGSGYEYFRAFDKNTSTYWAAPSAPQWVGYMFTVPVFVHQVRIVGYSSSGHDNNPTSITIQRSTNGTTWEDIATYNQEFTGTEIVLNIPLKVGFYRYWRVYVSSTNNNSSAYPVIKEINFIGFPQQ